MSEFLTRTMPDDYHIFRKDGKMLWLKDIIVNRYGIRAVFLGADDQERRVTIAYESMKKYGDYHSSDGKTIEDLIGEALDIADSDKFWEGML